jgi:hypothetical protein
VIALGECDSGQCQRRALRASMIKGSLKGDLSRLWRYGAVLKAIRTGECDSGEC